MKKRNCFVSNSSSSSFVIVGFYEEVSIDTIKEICLKIYSNTKLDEVSNDIHNVSFLEINDIDDLMEVVYKIKDTTSIFSIELDGEYIYIGIIEEGDDCCSEMDLNLEKITKLKEMFPDKKIKIISLTKYDC